MNPEFGESVRIASTRAEVRAAIHDLYQSLQSQIDERRPICRTSGRCCRFDEFGHRLYVTTAEMATFLHNITVHTTSPNLELRTQNLELKVLQEEKVSKMPVCPYQIDGLCSVHTIRPFGCRIFFCDESSTQWQHEQYEIFHHQLKQLHERYEIPYFYMEWRAALAAIGK